MNFDRYCLNTSIANALIRLNLTLTYSEPPNPGRFFDASPNLAVLALLRGLGDLLVLLRIAGLALLRGVLDGN